MVLRYLRLCRIESIRFRNMNLSWLTRVLRTHGIHLFHWFKLHFWLTRVPKKLQFYQKMLCHWPIHLFVSVICQPFYWLVKTEIGDLIGRGKIISLYCVNAPVVISLDWIWYGAEILGSCKILSWTHESRNGKQTTFFENVSVFSITLRNWRKYIISNNFWSKRKEQENKNSKKNSKKNKNLYQMWCCIIFIHLVVSVWHLLNLYRLYAPKLPLFHAASRWIEVNFFGPRSQGQGGGIDDRGRKTAIRDESNCRRLLFTIFTVRFRSKIQSNANRYNSSFCGLIRAEYLQELLRKLFLR